MKSIVLTGGGTAGHIIPNLALIDQLKKYFDNIYYISADKQLDKKIISSANIPLFTTTTVKFSRDKILENLKIPFLLKQGVDQASVILKKLQPSIVFSKGGYAALPTVYAAARLKIPVIMHESDRSLGLANKICLSKCVKYITSFKCTPLKNKGVFIGAPIRDKIFNGNGENIKKALKLDDKQVLLIMGGSLGANAINQFIYTIIGELKDYNIIHITGKNYKKINADNYYQLEYAENIEDYLALCDIVVSRCGAGSASEIMALNKKVIFIPLSNKSSRGDQVENAEYYSKNNGVAVINESDLDKKLFMDTINTIRNSMPNNYQYDRDTNKKIVELIVNYSLNKS